MNRLSDAFFMCGSAELAEKLIGMVLCVARDGNIIRKAITETEAYGLNDTACHGYRGRTKRNDSMFEKGGTVYVYLCYGLHEILNIAAGCDGEGQGVMIRGIEGATGPGKVTKVLGINRSFNYQDVTKSALIWLEYNGTDKISVEKFPRVGIDYAAKEDRERLWRFRAKNV